MVIINVHVPFVDVLYFLSANMPCRQMMENESAICLTVDCVKTGT